MTNDRKDAKPRRPRLRIRARLWKSVWLATAIVVAMPLALACQEQETSGRQGIIVPNRDCNRYLRTSLIIRRELHTAERANEIVRAMQETTSFTCEQDMWSAKISHTRQWCHHAEWENGTTVPESLALSGDWDGDGLTRDTIGNILVQFSEPPTDSSSNARCWMYDAPRHKWDRSID